MNNLELYDKVRSVPEEAKKPIKGGNLGKAGFTDINPVWRIKVLTEQFGPCGIGWYSEISDNWVEDGAAGEKIYFVKLKLYIKYDGEWSKPIEGTGGSKLINTFNSKLTSNDEALKMAETDAMSVACKKLGIAAAVYYSKDRTKYDIDQDVTPTTTPTTTQTTTTTTTKPSTNQDNRTVTHDQLKRYWAIAKAKGINQNYLDECIKVAFDLESKNNWKRSDYDAFTNYMQENQKEKTMAFLVKKILDKNKQVPNIKNFQKAG